MIETGNINGFSHEQACGAIGIVGAVLFANKNNYSFISHNLWPIILLLIHRCGKSVCYQ